MQTILQEGAFDATVRNAINTNFASVGVPFGNVWYVDGDSGSNVNDGTQPSQAFLTIAAAISAASANDTIYIKARTIPAGDTDPANYAETLIIPVAKSGLKLIGYGSGLAQGAQPQIKKGSGSTAHITVRAPGCLIYGISINMGGSTAAGVLLDDDGSTKNAFGTVIQNCYFKGNANKTGASGGGAVAWASTGGGWQVMVKGCEFYDCCTGINTLGTSASVPKNVVIDSCKFYSSANTVVDADICMSAGSGAVSVVISNCNFATVDVPAKSAGNTARYLDLTNVTNSALVGCTFGCIAQGTSAKTWKAAGSAALIPATVRMCGCYGESASDATSGEVIRAA